MEPISWADMQAYFGLMKIRPHRWEVDAVRALDDAFLDSRNKPKSVAKGAGALKQMIAEDKRKHG